MMIRLNGGDLKGAGIARFDLLFQGNSRGNSELGNMGQAVDFRIQFHKQSKRIDFEHFAFNRLSCGIAFVYAFPRIG